MVNEKTNHSPLEKDLQGIYIHIPFCNNLCPYCSFYSLLPTMDLVEGYTNALIKNISQYSGLTADTVYFGGGTPILLKVENLKRVLSTIKSQFKLVSPEITIEANPNSVSLEQLKELFEIGFNRISFGMQSAIDSELIGLGRKHNSNEVKIAVENAKKAGFKNISVDVMLGIPSQTMQSLKKTLDFAINVEVEHISCYMLKVEEGTEFFNRPKNSFADEDLDSEMYLFTVDYLEKNGFSQYEISNFSKNGFESRHNNKYWNLTEYLGFGASAHSFFEDKRTHFPNDIKRYIAEQKQLETEGTSGDLTEYVMLKLRLTKGLDLDLLKQKYDVDTQLLLERAGKKNYSQFFIVKNNTISLTPKGFLLSNSLISYLLSDV